MSKYIKAKPPKANGWEVFHVLAAMLHDNPKGVSIMLEPANGEFHRLTLGERVEVDGKEQVRNFQIGCKLEMLPQACKQAFDGWAERHKADEEKPLVTRLLGV